MSICAVAKCKNYSRKTKRQGNVVRYHRFPKDSSVCKKWVIKCKRADKFNVHSARVCSEHFSVNDYEDDMKNRLLGLPQRKILKSCAIPSLKLPHSKVKDGDIEEKILRNERQLRRRTLSDALARLKTLSPKRSNFSDNSDNLPFTYDQEADNQPFLDNQEAATEDDVNPESDLNQENYSDHEIDIKPDISLMEVHFSDPPKPQVTVTSAVSRELEPEPIHTTTSGAHSLKRKRSAYGDNDGNDDDNDNNFSHEFDFESDSTKVRQAYKLLKSVFEKGDRFDTFGERIAKRIRALPTDQVRLNVEQIIETVLWKAECGKYDNYHNPEDVAQDPLSLSPGTSKIFN